MNNADKPAMPAIAANNDEFLSAHDYDPVNSGLTKREHFAAMAMQGVMANESSTIAFYKEDAKTLAAYAVANADALLAALEAGD
jgi:hypothetical protein